MKMKITLENETGTLDKWAYKQPGILRYIFAKKDKLKQAA